MSDNKYAFLRYQILDECFSNVHRKFSLENLIKVCSTKLSAYYGQEITISKRTIQYDIEFMKGSGGNFAPIEKYKDGRSYYYRYSDFSYSFLKKNIDANEAAALKEAIVTMSRIKGLPGFDWLHKILLQLETSLDIEISDQHIISFEGNEYLKGIEYLHELYRNITNKEVIKLNYHPFSVHEPFDIILSPYYLKEYNNRWFLLGENHAEEYLQTIALDRIISITIHNEQYIENELDFEKYFNEIIGVTNFKVQKVEHVVLEIEEGLIPYLETKPLHHEQWIIGNILELRVKLNYELESAILSFGEKVKVMQPKILKDKIHDRILKMQNKY